MRRYNCLVQEPQHGRLHRVVVLLDEFVIADLLTRGVQIDTFGVGTALTTSKDAPALGGVYKLVDVASVTALSGRAKFSEEKITYPGRKQVLRLSPL